MANLKSLAKDTVIYGMSSIVGRFLNWCLMPLYVHVFSKSQYGEITNLYAYVALLLVVLTYGMETGFFRFANRKDCDPVRVYSTSLFSLGVSSTLFFGLVWIFLTPLSEALEYAAHPDYIWMLALILAMDAFTALPFAYLRYRCRPLRFAGLKLLSIFANIALNLFFIVLCPWLHAHWPDTVAWFYDPEYGIGYILLSNVLSSLLVLLALLPEITGASWRFDGALLRRMLRYSAPLLLLGVAGIMNQTLDKILFPFLVTDEATAFDQLGIYGANYKIAIVMVMFIQAFRFAYEPYVFAKNREEGDGRQSYVQAMKYFVIFGWLIFLGVMFYLDVLKRIVPQAYWPGLTVVPVVMLAELFFGVYFNLSFWYKLVDKTWWGALFSVLGCLITVAINVLFVPRWGYMACAWAAFCCYFCMMAASYFVGRRVYPIRYDLRSAARYTALALVLYGLSLWFDPETLWVRLLWRTALLAGFVCYLVKRDLPLREIPLLNRIGK